MSVAPSYSPGLGLLGQLESVGHGNLIIATQTTLLTAIPCYSKLQQQLDDLPRPASAARNHLEGSDSLAGPLLDPRTSGIPVGNSLRPLTLAGQTFIATKGLVNHGSFDRSGLTKLLRGDFLHLLKESSVISSLGIILS